MSITQRDIDRLHNTPCPKLCLKGLDGSVIHRRSWLEYVVDDHCCIKKLNRYFAQQWGEANLCPMDFVRLIWLELKPSAYLAVLSSVGALGLEKLAYRWHTDTSRVFARLIDEWVMEMEPENWWAADYSSGLLQPKPHDDGVAFIPPQVSMDRSFGRAQIVDATVPPRTVETGRRLGLVHGFSHSDVLDWMVRRRCDELGIALRDEGFALV